MSYNILANCYTQNDKYLGFYPAISDLALLRNFEDRRARIMSEIAGDGGEDQKADIICL